MDFCDAADAPDDDIDDNYDDDGVDDDADDADVDNCNVSNWCETGAVALEQARAASPTQMGPRGRMDR